MTRDNTLIEFKPEMANTLDQTGLYHMKSRGRILLGLTPKQLVENYNPNEINYIGIAEKR